MTRTTLVTALSVLALAAGCSSSSDSDGPGGAAGAAGSGGGDETCTNCAQPPAKPSNAQPGSGAGATLAVNKLFLGDKTTAGTADPDAWKSFGYDLDGYNSTNTSTHHCKLYVADGDTENPSVKRDGNNGIDNSFGKNLMPIITNTLSTASTTVNDNLANGTFTVILGIDKLAGPQDAISMPAALYAGDQLGATPKWDGTDEWPVFCELMTDCQTTGTKQLADGNKSKVQLPASYVSGGTWVSGDKTDIGLSLSMGGFTLSLNVRKAVMTAKIVGTPATSATDGVIAGVLDTEELISTLQKVAGRVSTSLCDDASFDTIAKQIRGASDIMKDGTQDTTQTCNGISLGMGFTMSAVKLGKVSDKVPEGTDPCGK